MSAICVIPARGGSRRIAHKNRKLFHGKPIIVYSIEVAQASGLFDSVVVNTDEKETAMIAWDYGAAIQVRPQYLANDAIGTQAVMRDALRGHNFNHACCLYACAPMVMTEDLHRAVEWLKISEGRGYAHIPGWFYFARTQTFLDDVPIEQSAPMTASADRYIDINEPNDFLRAEMMYAAWTDRILGRT